MCPWTTSVQQHHISSLNSCCITVLLDNFCATTSYRFVKQLLHTEIKYLIGIFRATTHHLEIYWYLKKYIYSIVLKNNLLSLRYTLLPAENVIFDSHIDWNNGLSLFVFMFNIQKIYCITLEKLTYKGFYIQSFSLTECFVVGRVRKTGVVFLCVCMCVCLSVWISSTA